MPQIRRKQHGRAHVLCIMKGRYQVGEFFTRWWRWEANIAPPPPSQSTLPRLRELVTAVVMYEQWQQHCTVKSVL